jgi:hypothetical protein
VKKMYRRKVLRLFSRKEQEKRHVIVPADGRARLGPLSVLPGLVAPRAGTPHVGELTMGPHMPPLVAVAGELAPI